MPIQFVVGQVDPSWGGPSASGPQFDMSAIGLRFRIAWHRPTTDEVESFRRQPIRFGLVRYDEHLFFVLAEVENVSVGFCDAPFSLGQLTPETRGLDHRPPDAGWAVTCSLICAETGIIHVLRMVTVSPAFSTVLDTLVVEQRANLPRYHSLAPKTRIDNAYARWPSTAEMERDALIIEQAGIAFPRREAETLA